MKRSKRVKRPVNNKLAELKADLAIEKERCIRAESKLQKFRDALQELIVLCDRTSLNWRWYIPAEMACTWNTMSEESKLAAFIVAMNQAIDDEL